MSTIPAHLEPGEPRPHPLVPTITATIFDERIHGSGIIRISVERVMHDWTCRHPVRRSRQLLRRNGARRLQPRQHLEKRRGCGACTNHLTVRNDDLPG